MRTGTDYAHGADSLMKGVLSPCDQYDYYGYLYLLTLSYPLNEAIESRNK